MTEQYWAAAATKNCVWAFQTRQQEWQEPNEELVSYWHTERIFLTSREANEHGEARPYEWGEKEKGWRIWGIPCDGIMAELLGQHAKEFEQDVEYITVKKG